MTCSSAVLGAITALTASRAEAAEAERNEQAELRAAHQATATEKKKRGPADNMDPDIEL